MSNNSQEGLVRSWYDSGVIGLLDYVSYLTMGRDDSSPRNEKPIRPASQKELREACRGTCFDPRTPHLSSMPWLHGALAQRALENLAEVQRQSLKARIVVR